MAGKRLIDAAKLFNAGTSVAKQHISLRKQQWDLFTNTSSLAKAVKGQTDRVTVTAKAAVELAKRFNEEAPSWQQAGQEAQRGAEAASRRAQENLDRAAKEAQNLARDAGLKNVADTISSVRRRPGDDGTLASLRKQEEQRVAQREKEDDGFDTTAQNRERNRRFSSRELDLIRGLRDTGSSWAEIVDALNAEPREKRIEMADLEQMKNLRRNGVSWREVALAMRHASETEPITAAADQGIAQDLRQSGMSERDAKEALKRHHEGALPLNATTTQPSSEQTPGRDTFGERPEPDSPPEGVNLNAFHSPRVSKMLVSSDSSIKNPYATRQKLPPQPLPEMVQASERWKKEKEQTPAAPEQAPPAPIKANLTEPSRVEASTTGADTETQDLAASIAQESQVEPEAKPYEMHESRVPATRFGRLWQYGGLATSMAFGAVGESFRRITGGTSEGSLMLSEANMNRLVAKLSRMRGAALKLGQMMSFQDSKVLPETINTVLQRVQDSADYMPASQRDKVLVRNLGAEWRDLFSSFEEKPFAAASIGQVHKATLKSNGKDVAVKVQYPGVRNSIDSDLNNLSLLLTASQLLPKGLFLDKTIANARTELGWECDYEREAKACIRFKDELVIDEPDTFAVPTIYTEASGPDVLTAEFMHGTAVTKIKDLTQSERDWIGTQILRLSLRELMEWRFMQTDPNWTNFLYNRQTRKLELLDFGASREFPDKFVVPYVSLLIAASRNDRDACRDLSIELGYLTGNESKEMLKAHIGSIMTLAEPFVGTAPEVYDFEDQTITDRVRSNIGLMLRERLAPPPEETYSLHRKLSGAFLLCARLKSKVPAREMFAKAVEVWEGREKSVKL
ncbi:hypothetical protein PRZ48_007867 [Zasmidium cellare]|uniref:ABC1 atypical kinase-like domain-containing protein n=1 Tax=Zasmidium cellare TaxID=395010 RepID=A0ABR0ELM1_ZASCE|nr:hypothetical protein PRZ48_007867 [Zasmidium cellare]